MRAYGPPLKLGPHLHRLVELIREQPDRTLTDLQEALGLSASLATIWRAVKRHAPMARRQTSTFIAGLRITGLTAPGVIDGAMDGDSFLAYVVQILVPTLAPGDIVIADNLAAHHVYGIQHAIEAVGATLRYLPAYSPDLNPIERCFAKLKTLVRAARCRSIDTLWPLLGACVPRFAPTECRNYFRHCGYSGARRS
jgi:transposase